MATFYTKLQLAVLGEILHEVGDTIVLHGIVNFEPLDRQAADVTMKGIQAWTKEFRPVFWKDMQNGLNSGFMRSVWVGKDALLAEVRKSEDNHSMDLYE